MSTAIESPVLTLNRSRLRESRLDLNAVPVLHFVRLFFFFFLDCSTTLKSGRGCLISENAIPDLS